MNSKLRQSLEFTPLYLFTLCLAANNTGSIACWCAHASRLVSYISTSCSFVYKTVTICDVTDQLPCQPANWATVAVQICVVLYYLFAPVQHRYNFSEVDP